MEEDRGLEVFSVSIAADASFDGHDFAVHPFRDRIGDAMRAVTDDVLDPFLDGPGHLLHRLQLGVNHAAIPVLEVGRC